MARIQGVDLPNDKCVEYALPYIYGIGINNSRKILTKLNIEGTKRVKTLSEAEVTSIQREIADNYVTEGDLRNEVRNNIRVEMEIGSYRGYRHKRGLPVRGQRTKTNARTRKGPRRAAVALKRVVTKK